jgi:D-galactarolactone isomerase
MPPGACDTHIHFYDSRFRVVATTVLDPPAAGVADYERFRVPLGLGRAVVVQPTTYGLDNSCQLEAVAALGGDARAVVVVDSATPDAELARLTQHGARGARFHMLAGGAVDWSELDEVARRVERYGWHIQLQLNGRELPARVPHLRRLPTPLVIDHVGRFMPPAGVDHAGFVALLSLLDTGRCWVKLSAPYESSLTGPPDYEDIAPLVVALVAEAPERLLWASNWPHPGQAAPPDGEVLLRLLGEWLPNPAIRRRVLVDNPAHLYGFAG